MQKSKCNISRLVLQTEHEKMYQENTNPNNQNDTSIPTMSAYGLGPPLGPPHMVPSGGGMGGAGGSHGLGQVNGGGQQQGKTSTPVISLFKLKNFINHSSSHSNANSNPSGSQAMNNAAAAHHQSSHSTLGSGVGGPGGGYLTMNHQYNQNTMPTNDMPPTSSSTSSSAAHKANLTNGTTHSDNCSVASASAYENG